MNNFASRNRNQAIHKINPNFILQKCNASLLDEDQKWREVVVEMIGCVPFYWDSFFANHFKITNMPFLQLG